MMQFAWLATPRLLSVAGAHGSGSPLLAKVSQEALKQGNVKLPSDMALLVWPALHSAKTGGRSAPSRVQWGMSG